MIEELKIEELLEVNGGLAPAEQSAYDAGHALGKAVGGFIQAYGIYALLFL